MNVMRAATVGEEETVKKWLTAPHTRHHRQVAQVLVEAAERGHGNICRLMLDSGQVSEDAISVALIAACRCNQQSIAQLIIKHGHINTHSMTETLLAACVNGHVRIVKWLISDVMQLSHSDHTKWWFTTACACDDLSVVKRLATQVDSDTTRIMSQALIIACYRGGNDVVKWLMSHTTSDVNSCDVLDQLNGEMTSLMAACYTVRYSIVRRLLQCVTPHTGNMMSGKVANTALHFVICCESDKHCQMQAACGNCDITTLTSTLYLSNVNLQVANDNTALHYACYRGDVEIVRMLLSVFADTHITDENRRTPAMIAELHGYTEVLPYLRCTLSDSHAIVEHVSTNNNSVSISILSIDDVTQHNTPHTNSSRPGTTVSTNNNNNSVSISMLSIKDVTQHNTPHTTNSRPGTTSKSTKRANMRVV